MTRSHRPEGLVDRDREAVSSGRCGSPILLPPSAYAPAGHVEL